MSRNADRQLVSTIKERWRDGAIPDARMALDEHPRLREVKSLALDLAYEEYCQRTAAGEDIDPADFCERFSRYRNSLACRLEVHELLNESPDLLRELEIESWPEVGDTICGFRLIEELGRGMIGRVFLAEEVALAKRKVAVKFTCAGVREAETLSRLEHPSIVPVYSVNKESLSGLVAICMPYRGRHTLQDFIDAAIEEETPPQSFSVVLDRLFASNTASARRAHPKLSYVQGVVQFAIAMCDALAHTHDKNILHLDLKPSNVLLTEQGEPLLLDFNLSLTKDSKRSLIGGTMPYMSPDQIHVLILGEGSEHDLDPRSDVFALGVILYQLLTGRHPFAGVHWRAAPEEVGNSLLELQHRGATPAVEVDLRIGHGLSRVLDKAMAADASQRYASMDEFGADLRREMQLPAMWRRYHQNHRRLVLLLLLFVAICISAPATLLALRDPYEIRELKRGWSLLETGLVREAEEAFSNVLGVDSRNHDALFGRGRAFQLQGEHNEAYDDFTRAFQYHPDGRYAACLGFAAAARGKDYVGIALECYANAIKAGFDGKELQFCIAAAQLARNQLAVAEQQLRRVLAKNPKYSVAWHQLALLLSGTNIKEALKSIDEAIAGDEPQPSMFADAAMIASSKKTVGAEEARQYLWAGVDQGLSWRDCEKLPPLLPIVEADPELMRRLKEKPFTPSRRLQRDPLGDPRISEAFFRTPSKP